MSSTAYEPISYSSNLNLNHFGDHRIAASPNALSYVFTIPPASLCNCSTPRCGLLARVTIRTSMSLRLAPSGSSKGTLVRSFSMRTVQSSILRAIAQRRVRWHAHVLRRPDDHATRAIYQVDQPSANWRRNRGKPRNRWKDIVPQVIPHTNQALKDVPTLWKDNESTWYKVSLVRSTPSSDEI